jgi:hypothetical protein
MIFWKCAMTEHVQVLRENGPLVMRLDLGEERTWSTHNAAVAISGLLQQLRRELPGKQFQLLPLSYRTADKCDGVAQGPMLVLNSLIAVEM